MSRRELIAVFAALAALMPFRAKVTTPIAHASPGSSRLESQPAQIAPVKPKKIPRPRPLGRGDVLERDAVSGELRPRPAHGDALNGRDLGSAGTIRSRVTLVQVPCTVTAPDGTPVSGMSQGDFRLFENGVPQEIAAFDASAKPAGIALVLDASPSIYRQMAQMRDAARTLAENVSPADEIAVISFSADAHVLLPFSTDRGLLDRTIDSNNLARVEDSSESNIYRSVFVVARELFRGRAGRKAMVLLTDGQDSGLGLTWNPASALPRPGSKTSGARLAFDDVARELGADGIALFIVSTETRPPAMTQAWLDAHRNEMLVTPEARKLGMPHYTLYLSELARRSGGQLYFLREIGNLNEIYRRIALSINAQYTLGFYPSEGTAHPGWRSLRVELSTDVAEGQISPGARVTHRGSYYVSAFSAEK